MARQRTAEVAEQREATPALRWLTLHAPHIARDVRGGQYLLIRCSAPGVYDPPLRRALFVAAANAALGQVGLLYAPGGDRGLGWLAALQAGAVLDVSGPLGKPFGLEATTRSLLLIGQGAALGALMLLAHEALGRGASATLLAAAPDQSLLPPPFLLPPALEYQSTIGAPETLYAAAQIAWADQIAAALPAQAIPALRNAVYASRIRSSRGLARVLLDGPLVCGTGACGVCEVALRGGRRLLCWDGPVLDLRDLAEVA